MGKKIINESNWTTLKSLVETNFIEDNQINRNKSGTSDCKKVALQLKSHYYQEFVQTKQFHSQSEILNVSNFLFKHIQLSS